MDIWTGFLIGLVGSLHCIGMCGPIAIAIPVFSESKFIVMLGRVAYNFGRIATYTLLGALFGLFGNRLVLFGLQQNLSIIIGVLIVVYILLPGKAKAYITNSYISRKINEAFRSLFGSLLSKKSNSPLFVIGMLNGLLPCGLVYMGIAGATASGSFYSGAAFMAMFGLGTFPIMLATSFAGKFINQNIRRRMAKLVPVFAFILGVLFILRGLNLGIPYISPKLVAEVQQQIICH